GVEGRKIASIGVGIRRWVTYHGFALNVCCDLNYFDGIVPCGIDGCAMTSIAELGRTDIAVADFARIMASSFASTFRYDGVIESEDDRLTSLMTNGGRSHHA